MIVSFAYSKEGDSIETENPGADRHRGRRLSLYGTGGRRHPARLLAEIADQNRPVPAPARALRAI